MECQVAVENAIRCYGNRELAERLAERKELRVCEQTDENTFLTEPFAELEVTGEIITYLWERYCVPGNKPEPHRMEHPYLFPLRAKFTLGEEGIWILPDFKGAWLCSRCGELVEGKLWKALFDFYPDEHPMLNELTVNGFRVWVSWEDLDELGLVPMEALFHQFSGGREALRKLAQSDENPFNHHPLDRVYVARDSQPVILERWRNQLKEFQESLRLN